VVCLWEPPPWAPTPSWRTIKHTWKKWVGPLVAIAAKTSDGVYAVVTNDNETAQSYTLQLKGSSLAGKPVTVTTPPSTGIKIQTESTGNSDVLKDGELDAAMAKTNSETLLVSSISNAAETVMTIETYSVQPIHIQ
jgi:hypothetical protein